MTTSTYVSQFDALTKKAESFVQSLRSAKIHPSKDQYTTFKAFSLRLCDAAAAIPVEIEALKKRQAESCEEGRKLISQAQLGRNDLTHLKNRGVFARNMKLFFGGPQDSAIDSDTIKARKRLTRERCDRICKLNPDGLISWAVAFAPSLWTANLMSSKTFDCVEEQIEPQDPVVWPSEIYDVLSALGDEDPLRGSHKYQEFLKAAEDEKEKAQSANQSRKRRCLADRPAPEVEPLPPVQNSELVTQIPAGQHASRMTQLPSLQQMALGAPSFNRDHTQDWGGTVDVEEHWHPLLHHQSVHTSSLQYKQQKPAAADSLLPYKENREMKYMYTNAPASNISKMPEPFRAAVQNSQQWKSERSQGLETTGCWPSLFPKDNRQDVSFTIWCGNKDGAHLTKFFGGQLEISS